MAAAADVAFVVVVDDVIICRFCNINIKNANWDYFIVRSKAISYSLSAFSLI